MTAATALQVTYGGGDPNFPYVVFLSSMSGADGSTTVVDESSYAEDRTVVDTGIAPERCYITTADSKLHPASLVVNEGTTMGFTMTETRFARPSGTRLAIEGWVYPATRNNSTATPLIVDMIQGGTSLLNLSAYALGANDFTFRDGMAVATSITHVKPADGFTFVQIFVDDSDIMRLYMDGTLKYTSAGSVGSWNSVSNTIRIAGVTGLGGGYACVAYFNEWRITIGGTQRPVLTAPGRFPRY